MNGRTVSPDPGPAATASLQQHLQAASGSGQSQLPQALQNLQRILQSQLANVNPIQLQQALQRQQVTDLILDKCY